MTELRLRLTLAVACLLLAGCTDGATRIAAELEASAAAMRKSGATTSSLHHVPEKDPEGCAAAYTIQLSQNAGMLIWCKDTVGGPATSSHMTTSHLRYVDVPQTWIVDKAAGETTLIDLARQGDRVVVVGLR